MINTIKYSLLPLCILLLPCFLIAQSKDNVAIKKLITECYIEPLYLRGDLDKIKEGFHEGFHMYVYYKGEFSQRTRDEWVGKIQQNRKPNQAKRNYTWEFAMIDVEDQTAVVKLILNLDGHQKYIDYLTLYKFAEGWQVITKQFSMY